MANARRREAGDRHAQAAAGGRQTGAVAEEAKVRRVAHDSTKSRIGTTIGQRLKAISSPHKPGTSGIRRSGSSSSDSSSSSGSEQKNQALRGQESAREDDDINMTARQDACEDSQRNIMLQSPPDIGFESSPKVANDKKGSPQKKKHLIDFVMSGSIGSRDIAEEIENKNSKQVEQKKQTSFEAKPNKVPESTTSEQPNALETSSKKRKPKLESINSIDLVFN